MGVRRHLPAVGLAVHLRAGLPGRADRAGRGAGAGVLLLRRPFHRRRRRGPGQGGGPDARPTTSGSSRRPAGAAEWCARQADGAQVTRLVDGRLHLPQPARVPRRRRVRPAPGRPRARSGARWSSSPTSAGSCRCAGRTPPTTPAGSPRRSPSGTDATGATAARSSTGGAPRRPRPFAARQPVYQTLPAELTAMVGPAVYGAWPPTCRRATPPGYRSPTPSCGTVPAPAAPEEAGLDRLRSGVRLRPGEVPGRSTPRPRRPPWPGTTTRDRPQARRHIRRRARRSLR